MTLGVWKYKMLRGLGRLTVETASLLTLRRMPPMVSAAAIVCRDGRILMIRDTAQGMLVLPGGHLHWSESVDAGVRREVLEETGYVVAPGRLVATLSSESGQSDRGIIRVIVEAAITGGAERSSPEGAVEWLPLEDVDRDHARDAGILRQWMLSRNHPDHTPADRTETADL